MTETEQNVLQGIKLAFIGAGVMAESMLAGLLKQGLVTPDQIVAGTANPDKMPIVDKIALENAIDQLPEGYKNVFVLHDVEGFEHEEVAKILGCSVGTSKSQLHKARLKLRKLLKKKANPRLLGYTG